MAHREWSRIRPAAWEQKNRAEHAPLLWPRQMSPHTGRARLRRAAMMSSHCEDDQIRSTRSFQLLAHAEFSGGTENVEDVEGTGVEIDGGTNVGRVDRKESHNLLQHERPHGDRAGGRDVDHHEAVGADGHDAPL